ncbi:hypothetical protein FPE01S_02_06840 [Flavihumibacter petaseus NBRC 106054]|uniref:Uncharacterized protein n=1 Tax=Flavihumibacter petaseus NBRC 106054 TaxID=1220578 RepID=A0A0E9N1E0_9BACT|nr:hypothetical protein FPE01S_02_06840 [Flavihumibacter petaseus NBRC 106054]
MFNFLAEVIFGTIFQILLAWPVAIVRWLISGRREKFTTWFKANERDSDYFIGIAILIIIVVIFADKTDQ